jgi:hypothetical protein
MKYKIQKLEKRHSYHGLFQYYIGFSKSMWQDKGPLHFSRCQLWFIKTYGWSAEVPIYVKINTWCDINQTVMFGVNSKSSKKETDELSNPHWSWTNGIGDQSRIYVASEAELAFFCLSWPIDQK